MLSDKKSALAFAATTLLGAGLLAANFSSPGADQRPGSGEEPRYWNDGEDSASQTSQAYEEDFEDDGGYEDSSYGDYDDDYEGDSGGFGSENELIDDTRGFDPSPGSTAGGARSGTSPDVGPRANSEEEPPDTSRQESSKPVVLDTNDDFGPPFE